jgi:hypothetical protein
LPPDTGDGARLDPVGKLKVPVEMVVTVGVPTPAPFVPIAVAAEPPVVKAVAPAGVEPGAGVLAPPPPEV